MPQPLLAMALAATVALGIGSVILTANAEERHEQRHGEEHREDRDHRGGYGGGYYNPPPVVYGSPCGYGGCPPPVVYRPGVSVLLPGIFLNLH